MKPSQDLGSSCYQFPAPAGRCGGSEAAQRGCAPLQSPRQSLPARPGLPGSLYKFLLCRAGASSPFQAAVTSSCQHLEPPWARNQQELGTGDPSPRPAVWDGQARLLGKPSLNREHPLQTPPALPGTNPALQGPQTTPKPPPCPQPALLKGWQHFLSAPSQKQNTQHWQPRASSATKPQLFLPCAALGSHWEGQQLLDCGHGPKLLWLSLSVTAQSHSSAFPSGLDNPVTDSVHHSCCTHRGCHRTAAPFPTARLGAGLGLEFMVTTHCSTAALSSKK